MDVLICRSYYAFSMQCRMFTLDGAGKGNPQDERLRLSKSRTKHTKYIPPQLLSPKKLAVDKKSRNINSEIPRRRRCMTFETIPKSNQVLQINFSLSCTPLIGRTIPLQKKRTRRISRPQKWLFFFFFCLEPKTPGLSTQSSFPCHPFVLVSPRGPCRVSIW